MRVAKFFILIGMAFSLLTAPTQAAQPPVHVESVVKDGSIINGDVYYPDVKKKKYSAVLLLHSLGYNSAKWAPFAEAIADAGYAVITVDFRGHGRSVYTSKLNRQSWINYKRTVFQKYPDDVLAFLKTVKEEHPLISFEEWGIVGADIGSNTAILVAEKAKNKPKTLVLVTPHESYKGLFVPLAIVEMGPIPILTISSTTDRACLVEQEKLKRYAQAEYVIKNFPSNTTGMLMVNVNKKVRNLIINWLEFKVAQFE